VGEGVRGGGRGVVAEVKGKGWEESFAAKRGKKREKGNR